MMMDLSVLYGSAQHTAALGDPAGAGLGSTSTPVPQPCQELQLSCRDSGGRALNCEEFGALSNDTDRLNGIPSLYAASRLKGGPRKAIPGPQPKGPANVKRGYRRMWQQLSGEEGGQGQLPAGPQQLGVVAWWDTTVEDLVAIVQRLPHREPVVPAVVQGLYYQDSRGLAAMLKELSKSGHGQQALELFDWLQNLPLNHDLAPLADVFSFTTAISLCGGLRKMDFAVELLWKMRQRGINCNVHTYSCLMNVCIKNNDLDMALNVFQKLQADGLQANIVTFNTLIDAMGKAGRWQDAIGVLDIIDQQGVEPEARTFNTIIIACNLCGQPLQALEVYKKMCMRGIEATDTTYTALISAYAKAERLEDALAAYKIMISEGHRRNAITYTSLIYAAEKSSHWQLALELFHRVAVDNVAPNAAIFNAAMSACAQGAQAMEARRIYAAMKDGLCRPDALTLTSLATAYQRAGKWDWAEQVLNEVMETRARPDAALYATIIEGLWQSGSQPQRLRALKRFNAALQSSVPGLAASISGGETAIEVVVPTLTPGATLLALHHVLSNLQHTIQARSPPDLSRALLITLGRSQRLPRDGRSDTAAAQQAALTFLTGLKCPYTVVPDSMPRQLQASFDKFVEWLLPVNIDAAIGFDNHAIHPGSQELNGVLDSLRSRGVPPIEGLDGEKGGMASIFQPLAGKHSYGQASTGSESGSLHSLPAYSYLAKPFEPPSGQGLGRSRPPLQPHSSKDVMPNASCDPQTPSHMKLEAPEGMATNQSTSQAAGASPPQASTALPKGLMQPLKPTMQDGEDTEYPVSTGANAAARVASKQAPANATSNALPPEGFLEQAASCGHLHSTGSELPAVSRSLSIPETGSTLEKLPLHNMSSHPSGMHMADIWVEPAGTVCPTLPMLPSPEPYWASGLDQLGQPLQAVGSMSASGAGDPTLQARLVNILEALGQGMNQQLPAPYLNTPVDALQPSYNPSADAPGLLMHNPASLAQLHQAFAAAIPLQPSSSGLMSHMAERFSSVGLGSQNSSVYDMNGPGLPCLPEIYQAPGGLQMGSPALPPEHIAAWQAAWLQQPLSAAAHTYQD